MNGASEPRTDMIDTVSYCKGPNDWKFGVSANFHPFRSYNADNFGGTYTFASLAAYEAGQPTLFTISAGNPLLSFQQNDYAWFAQYERKIGSASCVRGSPARIPIRHVAIPQPRASPCGGIRSWQGSSNRGADRRRHILRPPSAAAS